MIKIRGKDVLKFLFAQEYTYDHFQIQKREEDRRRNGGESNSMLELKGN